MNKISWKLYLIFMTFCYLMAIVVFFFYPESAGKSLEEMDFLFAKDRTPWVFLDQEAKKIGAIFDRDMEHGEALTVFDKSVKDVVEHVDRNVTDKRSQTEDV